MATLFDTDKPPKPKRVPPLNAQQWGEYAAWLRDLEAAVGEERHKACCIYPLAYWYSGWTVAQFIRERLEPLEKTRQPC